MINHAMYKSGLFLSAGSVEHRTGTTELKKLGGLRRDMPLTAFGFTVCALAISGVWPLNGFVSKEMVFHGALETGLHDLRHRRLGRGDLHLRLLPQGRPLRLLRRRGRREVPAVKESQPAIVIPILVLAGLCILFGVYNKLPLTLFIQPILEGHVEAGAHLDFTSHALAVFNPVALISIGCLVLAFLLHRLRLPEARRRKAYLASEPVHNLPVVHQVYDLAEAPGLRPLRAGRQGPPRAVDWSCSRASTGPSTSSSRRSSPSPARNSPAS